MAAEHEPIGQGDKRRWTRTSVRRDREVLMGPSNLIYDRAPLRVYWEVTRACDLACRHCRAEAVPLAHPRELTSDEGLHLLERLAVFGDPKPHLVFTGGDPLKRPDLWVLIVAAQALGFAVSVAPSATGLLGPVEIRRFKATGVEAISLSLDGSTAARHDAFRGVSGTFARTLDAARVARTVGLPFQVNTLAASQTLGDLPALYGLTSALGAARWSLFFLVSVGRGALLEPLAPREGEDVMAWIAELAGRDAGPIVTTTEAPHFRRVMLTRPAGCAPGTWGGLARREWHHVHLAHGRDPAVRLSAPSRWERARGRHREGVSRVTALPLAAPPGPLWRTLRPV